MARERVPVTQAIRQLRAAGVMFEGHPYGYISGGGTAQFASEHGVDEHRVIKTLIMEDEQGRPMVVLMHGDREVSTKALARHIGAKSVKPCTPATADRHSGYQVGGTSPFGTRRNMPVYCEQGVLALEDIYINGGKRGFIISLATAEMIRVLQPTLLAISQ